MANKLSNQPRSKLNKFHFHLRLIMCEFTSAWGEFLIKFLDQQEQSFNRMKFYILKGTIN